MKKFRRKNFTLIEVVIVIVILVTLASIATPMLLDQLDKAKVGTAKTQIKNLSEAVTRFKMDNNKYPD